MRHQSLWQRRKGRLPAWIPSQKNVLHFSVLSLGYQAGGLCFCGQCAAGPCVLVSPWAAAACAHTGYPSCSSCPTPSRCPHRSVFCCSSSSSCLWKELHPRSFFVVHSPRCLLAHDSSVFISVAEVEQRPGPGLSALSHSFPFLSPPCSIKSNPDFSSHNSGLRARCCCALPFSAPVPF